MISFLPLDGPDALFRRTPIASRSGNHWGSVRWWPCRSPVLPSALGSRGEGASVQFDSHARDPKEVHG